MFQPSALTLALLLLTSPVFGAVTQPRYYAHETRHDSQGVIAPWYQGLNGQCDLRVRIAAETLKRYPWTTTNTAIAPWPDYLFTSLWQISSNGTITPKSPGDWMNGDLGQRATSTLNAFVDYYRYTGDPAAIAHLTYMADFLVDHCVTPPDHPWPGIFISVPVKGKAYGKCDPSGMIQLDLCASTGQALLRAYQLTGNTRWLRAARHWGDLLADHCNLDPAADPWPRYANPETVKWKDNKQTGGVTMILAFLDELIRLDPGAGDNRITAARDAGRRYLKDKLLPAWAARDTWGRYFWDWVNDVQNCLTTPDAARYLLDHPDDFANWRCDARNVVTLFLNHSSVSAESRGDVYSGAWAFPEASQCCQRSLWYSPLGVAPALAQYAVQAHDPWARELACRMLVLQTYDVHETGVTEDNIDGGIIVNGDWLNIAHPLPLRWVLAAMSWLPEELGANRENHLIRSSAVVNSVVYGKGCIEYSTFDAPLNTTEVLRLAFVPKQILADGRPLPRRRNLDANGYTVKTLPNGDAIVTVRHDGAKKVVVTGADPQQVIAVNPRPFYVSDKPDGAFTVSFRGNQVRLIGTVGPNGGLADLYLDGEKQLVHIDCWNPAPRDRQVIYYRNGLPQGTHTLRVVARGEGNPYSKGTTIGIDSLQCSAATGVANFPSGTGPRGTQRMVFGYTGRDDLRDSGGNTWRPATELVTRIGETRDSVAECWWTTPAADLVKDTPDPDLYRYGVHGRDFWVNLTVGPGHYYARLKFAAARGMDPQTNCFDIRINGQRVVERLDVTATAGGANRAVDLVFNDITPANGVIEIRFTAAATRHTEDQMRGEAFVQALELGPGRGGAGVNPVSAPAPSPDANLLSDPGFEHLAAGLKAAPGFKGQLSGWQCEFIGPAQSYLWQESDYSQHPDWGLPEFKSGKGAIRTHTDDQGQTRVYQDVEIKPGIRYTASVWVRAADLHGKGFGRHTNDSAGLQVLELDAQGKVLHRHEKVETTQAGPYTRLVRNFTAGPGSVQARFILETRMHCPYTEGHVTYDDCALRALPTVSAETFDYFQNSWSVIGLKDYQEGTRITPDNELLLTNKTKLRLSCGSRLIPLSRKQTKTLLEGWLPVVLLATEEDGVRYAFTLWATPLPTVKDWQAAFDSPAEDDNYLNWIRVKATNLTPAPALARVQLDLLTTNSPAPMVWSKPLAPRQSAEYSFRVPFAIAPTFQPADLQNQASKALLCPPASALANANPQLWLDRTVSYWREVLSHAARIEVPSEKATQALRAAHVCQLIANDHGVLKGGEGFYDEFYIRDGAYQMLELEEGGLLNVARKAVGSYLQAQKPDGHFETQKNELDGNGQALWVLWQFYKITGDRAWLQLAFPQMRRAAEWTMRARRETPADSPFAGLLPNAVADGEYLWDGKYHIVGYDFWNLRGLLCVADAARELGAQSDAHKFQTEADDYRKAIDAAWQRAAVTHFPPSWETAGTHWGNTETLWPTELFAPEDARVGALLAEVRQRHGGGFCEGTIRWTGSKEPAIHPYLSAYTTMASLIRGEHDQFVEEFYWYLLHSTATHAFPEGIFYERRFAWSDTIPHATGAANFAFLLRHALVHERGDELHLLAGAPDGWLGDGKEIRVQNAPTHFGPMSLKIHGTAKGVEVKIDPPRRQPPKRIVLHLPNSRPSTKTPKGLVVEYRPDQLRHWDFSTVVETLQNLPTPVPLLNK